MRWLLPIIWMGIIVYLSLMPASDLPNHDLFRLLFVDKWIHAFLFFILALLLFYSWEINESYLLKAVVLSFTCILFGISIEVMQNEFTTTRKFEWLDIVSDSVGTLAYVAIWLRRRSIDFLKKS